MANYARATLGLARYLYRRELRYLKKVPVDTLFFLTYRCTSRCRTCTMWQRNSSDSELSLSDWQRIARESYDLGARFFELFGGDVLLRKDVAIPLATYIKSLPGTTVDIPTNCNLIDEETAHELVESGLDNIWLSIDGVGMDHDQTRGRQGTFERVDRAVKLLSAVRGTNRLPALRANCTISSFNYHTFDRVLPYAEASGLDSVHLEFAGEFSFDSIDHSLVDGIRPRPYYVPQNGGSVLLNEDQARVVKEQIQHMKEVARKMKLGFRTENVDKLTIKQMVTGEFGNQRCYVSRTKIMIDPSGKLLPCPFYPDWAIGNVRNTPLPELWRSERHQRFLTQRHRRSVPVCRQCILGVQRNSGPFRAAIDYVRASRSRLGEHQNAW